jgi:hypothetical protein
VSLGSRGLRAVASEFSRRGFQFRTNS